MKFLYSKPLEQLLAEGWQRINPVYRKAFFVVIIVNFMAFGFEMTNLTLHHDDIRQIFIQDANLGYDSGRFGLGWLHYYIQSTYIMPFLQMLEGIIMMVAYGLLIAYLWGVRKVTDVVLIASIVSVFPFMAQIYQYNTAMATYPIAHLLVATAVVLSIRATPTYMAVAALLYLAAFSIYQSIIANAATLFLLWALTRLLFEDGQKGFFSWSMAKSALGVFVSVIIGGLCYVGAVSLIDIDFGSYQAVGQAFNLKEGIDLSHTLSEIIRGSQSFYRWPESYFPGYLKSLQLIFILIAGLFCAWLPKGLKNKATAMIVLGLSLFAPRLLQVLHPEGHYHNLTLTAYALVIAGCVMIVMRTEGTAVRNVSLILTGSLLVGYIHQCNVITTINYLNTQAHYATLTQILTRLRTLPDGGWDGKSAVVVGNYKMPWVYPYRKAIGVASDYIRAYHMQNLAQLMRDEITFLSKDQTPPAVWEFAASHPHWPHPDSVGVVEGVAVVVLSKGSFDLDVEREVTNASIK